MKKPLKSMHIASLELFLVAAENENFSTTAEYLNITPAAVSRSIRRLEKRIGFNLFSRNTRQVKLTPEGQIYYQKCAEILDMLNSAAHSVTTKKNTVAGKLRISVPESFFIYKMSPCLADFSATYPDLQLDFYVTNRNIDFVAEHYDLSIRLIRQDTKMESFLIKKDLLTTSTGLYASPTYLTNHGMPTCPEDLHRYQCINFSSSQNNKKFPWTTTNMDFLKDTANSNSIQVFNSIEASKRLAINSCGVVQLFRFSVQEELHNNQLVEILPQHTQDNTWLFCLLYPSMNKNSNKLKVFIDYCLKKIT